MAPSARRVCRYWHPATESDKRKPFDAAVIVDIYENELKVRRHVTHGSHPLRTRTIAV